MTEPDFREPGQDTSDEMTNDSTATPTDAETDAPMSDTETEATGPDANEDRD